ncbi:hypothetical protein [Streptomyces flavidovirens]|uniref:hypothetical protein n=1 Tax=Streptomyces flavidovirens TaxID=67298 RepID=UPI00056A944E|nr:hypothetical protein [Streptomyces flavidovirens]
MNRAVMRLSTFAAAAVAFSGVIMTSQSARAAATCSTASSNLRVIDLPGLKPDTQIGADVCADPSADKNVKADVTLNWGILDDQVQDAGKRFTSFKVISRLENRPSPSGVDRVVASTTCDFTNKFNQSYANATGLTCSTPTAAYNADLHWSGDATVVYDIEGDGKGAITWQLTGTPLVS